MVAKGYRNFYSAASMAGFDKSGIQSMYSDVLVASRSIGASQQQVEGALLALEQMLSKGKVSMEELRRQLGNALPGAFEIGAKAMGVTTQKFNEMVKAGISAQEFVPKFTKELLKTYEGAFPEAIKSLDYAMVNLRTSWKLFQYEIMNGSAGQGFAQTINALTEFLRSPEAVAIAKGIGQALNLIARALGVIVKHFRFFLFLFGVNALSKLPILLNTIKIAIANIGKAGMIAGKQFLWLTLIASVLYGIYLIIDDIYTYIKHPEWQSVTKDLAQKLPFINESIDYMKEVIKETQPILHDVSDVLKEIVQSFMNFEKRTGIFRKGVKALIVVFLWLGKSIAWCVELLIKLFGKLGEIKNWIDKHKDVLSSITGGAISGAVAGGVPMGLPGAIGGGLLGGIVGGLKHLPIWNDQITQNPQQINQRQMYSPVLNKTETYSPTITNNVTIQATDRTTGDITNIVRNVISYTPYMQGLKK